MTNTFVPPLIKYVQTNGEKELDPLEYYKSRANGDIMILRYASRRPNLKLWKRITKEIYELEKATQKVLGFAKLKDPEDTLGDGA